MPIPTYDQFIDPLLRCLSRYPEGARTGEIQEFLADELKLTESERQELLPSGAQPVYKNRIGWSHDRLKRAGLSTSPKRGLWKLTDKGADFVKRTAFPLTPDQISKIAVVQPGSTVRVQKSETPDTMSTLESPDERLNSALSEINESVGAELLEMIMQSTPKFFEFLVLDLLHAMGYGTSRDDLKRVGGTGDAGIDGVISLDRLGLEKVYIQAKRWSNPVGRPAVQEFYGALAGQRASKGGVHYHVDLHPAGGGIRSECGAHCAHRRRAIDGVDDRTWGGGEPPSGEGAEGGWGLFCGVRGDTIRSTISRHCFLERTYTHHE